MFNHSDYSIRAYVECTKEERVSCACVIHEIQKLVKLAIDEGVLALEAEAEKASNAILQKGLSLMIDGIDPHLVEEILHASNVYSHKTGVELLKDILYTAGVLAIQSGYNPRVVEEMLLSYLGEDARAEAKAFLDDAWEKDFGG